MINIFVNILKKNYFFIIVRKLIKKFEKDSSSEAKEWARLNVKQTTKEFCQSIDASLYDEIISDIKTIKEEAENKLSKFSESIKDSQLALFLANRSNLGSRLFSIESERDQLEKSLATIKEELSGAKELLNLINEENKELSPLIAAGALGASEKFRLKRENAQLNSEIQVLKAKVLETEAGYLKLEAEIKALQSSYERDIFDERAKYINELSFYTEE